MTRKESLMCGRFVSARKRAELLEEFAVQRDAVAADRDPTRARALLAAGA